MQTMKYFVLLELENIFLTEPTAVQLLLLKPQLLQCTVVDCSTVATGANELELIMEALEMISNSLAKVIKLQCTRKETALPNLNIAWLVHKVTPGQPSNIPWKGIAQLKDAPSPQIESAFHAQKCTVKGKLNSSIFAMQWSLLKASQSSVTYKTTCWLSPWQQVLHLFHSEKLHMTMSFIPRGALWLIFTAVVVAVM